MRIVLLKGPSQYGSLRLHVDQLAQALVNAGHEAVIVEPLAPDGQVQLNAALSYGADAFFAFSGVGADVKFGEESAYDRVGSVYASLYVDHPVHHWRRLTTPVRSKAGFFLDRSHLQFVSASPAARSFSQLGFMPPGANELPEPPDLSDEAFARRDIPLMFTGTYRGAPQAPWRTWPESPARNLCETIAQRMAADARLTLLEALRQALKELGAELTPKLFGDVAPLLAAPQAFADAYHRDALLHALGQAGLELHIWGNGWDPLAERYGCFVHHGEGSFVETLQLLRRARVVLNVNNGFVLGGHERVFTAMCAGAAIFTDANPYYQEAFATGREIAAFTWSALADAPGELAELVADTPRAAQIARAGAIRAQAEHRWSERAQRLVKAVKAAR